MSTTSHSFESVPMQRRSEILTLGSNPIVSVGSDRRLIDFEETRFRINALRLQNALRPLATELAAELGVPLTTLEFLSVEKETDLTSGTYCAFDFLDIKARREKGFLKTRWIPFAVFVRGERVFSLHASYNGSESKISGLTMRLENQDEYTRCSTSKAALKVGRSFLRTYILQANS